MDMKESLREYANDSGILDGIMQWVVIAVVVTILPTLLYQVSVSQGAIPSASLWNTTQSNVNSTVGGSFGTLTIVLVVLAIVIIVSVLLLLAGRRK